MSSSNTDLLSNSELTAKVALSSSDNAETEEADLQQVATLVKAHKDLTASVASYEAMFKAVTRNMSEI
ncbi:hypothetical protein BDP27DRAFT_1423768 [Rhodocollybia butyracea]|uniref:Uncharacterized protein n=1 Tax=Rhodocollybia butyracea TaxID=206335 RepID=A0A9P5PQZ5_9AGAR|nr:hypothetical protein BDP27DRAFT_1423768 [Rhodocollybia butyracea]